MKHLILPITAIVISSIALGIGLGQIAGQEQMQKLAIQRNVGQYNFKDGTFEFKQCLTDNTKTSSE